MSNEIWSLSVKEAWDCFRELQIAKERVEQFYMRNETNNYFEDAVKRARDSVELLETAVRLMERTA